MYLAMLPGSPRAGTTERLGISHVDPKATRQDGLLGPLGYFVHVNGTTPAILLLCVTLPEGLLAYGAWSDGCAGKITQYICC